MKSSFWNRESVVVTALFVLLIGICGLILVDSKEARAYNSEEHRVLVDEAMALVTIDPSLIQLVAPTGFRDWDHLPRIKFAKELAVGFSTNDPDHYDDQKKKVQDNSYWDALHAKWAQITGNLKIWIPPESILPRRTLAVKTIVGSQETWFTMGQLVAFYGDYRRTTYCENGDCYLTDGNVNTVEFRAGTDCWGVWGTDCGFRPDPMPTSDYLASIASGLWPPHGGLGNIISNTARDDEYDEVAWWGDEMLRLAYVNDWHFSKGAVAWYVGMHRLALLAVKRALEEDPKYWNHALHYEANALHSLTDLFAFGHVVTNRDWTSYEIIGRNNLQNHPAFRWMENALAMGGGRRNADGAIFLDSHLPDVSDYEGNARNDFMMSYPNVVQAGKALGEKGFHDEFNETGATVRNLNGDRFLMLGDYGYRHTMHLATRKVIREAVRASVQALFDAGVALNNGSTIAEISRSGSSYFEALKFLPVFIESDANGYFTGRYTLYAKAVDEITGANFLPTDLDGCQIEHLDGTWVGWPESNKTKCTDFPTLPTAVEDEQPNSVPTSFSLSQNYPNPFNPGSTIEFALPRSSEVTITIYNALGQTVRQVVQQTYPAGTHRVQWDGRDDAGVRVPSGVYIYKIQAGEFSASRRMSLVR